VNLSQRVVVGYDAIRAEVDPHGAFARISVTSPGLRALPRGSRFARALDPLVPDPARVSAVRVETVYEVRPGEPFVRIATTLVNTGSAAAPVFAFGDVWMRGGRGGRGFMGDVRFPERGRGFAARDMSGNIFGSLGALATFTHAGLLGSADFPAIAYALYAPERVARGLPLYGIAGEHATLAFGLVGDPAVPEIGLGSLARALFAGELAAGATWRYERRLRVAGASGVAALDAEIRHECGAGDPDAGVTGAIAVGGRHAVVAIEMRPVCP
jgi:hypothetical protein